MLSRLTVFRIAAVIILLLTGAELIACEIMSPGSCETFGEPGDRTTDSGDACLCCCYHIVVRAPISFEPSAEAMALEPVPPIRFSSFELAGVYHPPRA